MHGYSDLSAELASTTRYALVVVSSSFDRQSRRLEISKLLQTAATRSSVVILAESGRMEGTLVAEDARVLRKPFTMPDFAETVRGSLSEGTD